MFRWYGWLQCCYALKVITVIFEWNNAWWYNIVKNEDDVKMLMVCDGCVAMNENCLHGMKNMYSIDEPNQTTNVRIMNNVNNQH